MLMLLVVAHFTLYGQTQTVLRGVVVDEASRQPLEGVSIHNINKKNSSNTTQTGGYSIHVDIGDILIFSYLGYENKQIKVDKIGVLNVAMSTNNQKLEEVVVIGYGETTRQENTGAVGQVDINAVNKAPVMSFSQALAGRVAGVTVSSVDGQPGGSENIVIRGAGSLTQSTAPLYVVDGFPVEDLDLSSINTSDIETINVLKDASATAIYGSRGANGVIIIETKKGKSGKAQITFDSSLGYQQPWKLMEMMTPYEFLEYHSQLKLQTTEDMYFKELDENGVPRTLEWYRNVQGIDWQKLVLKDNNITERYDMAVRGGNAETKYSLSGSFHDYNGVVVNTGNKRLQGRFSLEQKIGDKLEAGVSYNYSGRTTNGIMANQSTGGNLTSYIFYNIWGYRPVTGSGNPDDLISEDFDADNMTLTEARFNPLIIAQNTIRDERTQTSILNAHLVYDITKELRLKMSGGHIGTHVKRDIYYNSKHPSGSPSSPFNNRGLNGSVNYDESNTWSSENFLTYRKVFNKLHSVNAVAGFSLQERKRVAQGVSVSFLPNEELGFADFSAGVPYAAPSLATRFTLLSTFYRLNYNYKWKYFFTGTFRADGSSKFAPENRYGYFPSAAVSWNMKRENFLKDLNYLSTSRLRVSYGVTGNNRVGDFNTYSQLTLPLAAGYPFNNSTPIKGAVVTALGTPNLRWESSYQFNVGYEIGFLKDRFKLTVDYYDKKTENLLLYANIPYTSGFGQAYQNIGSLRNKGLELTINTTNIRTKNFFWETNFNISFNRNEVLGLAEGEQKRFTSVSFDNLFADPLYLAQVGKPLATFYGYIWDGVYQLDDFDNPSPNTYILRNDVATNGSDRQNIQPGHIKYRDLNSDGVVDDNDLTVLGNALPIHTGGFMNSLNYKGIDLSIFFQWSYGNKIFNANRLLLEGNALNRTLLNQFGSYADRWSMDNQDSQNFIAGGEGPTGRYSSRTLEDGSFVRLKTVSLGYNLPISWINRLKLSSLRVNVSAQNLYTWTTYSGLDPEVSTRNSILTPGFDYSAYPHARTVVVGINAAF